VAPNHHKWCLSECTQKSDFAWTITTLHEELWTGTGTVPGTQWDAYSGRAEGFGIIAAFIFLEKYIKSSQSQIPTNSNPIQGFCNNLGLIQQIKCLQEQHIPNPSLTIANDYNLLKEIFNAIAHISITIKLNHVKVHQDEGTNIWEHTYKAQLNVLCNERASIALQTLLINLQSNPTLTRSYPHLSIDNQTIVWQNQEYLQEAAWLPEYC